jgi:protein tyrosine/serine phosphatase
MRTKAIRVLVAVPAVVAPSIRTQEDRRLRVIPNFHKVNDVLYRGAQPKSGGLEHLRELGIKTVVNLRAGDFRAKKEESDAQIARLRYFNFPLVRWGRPQDKEMEQVLSIINNPDNQPVFVHCQHGADRTGVVIAAYRITHDGWTSKQAIAEIKRYGLKPWQLGMRDYIDDFYKRQKVATAPRKP